MKKYNAAVSAAFGLSWGWGAPWAPTATLTRTKKKSLKAATNKLDILMDINYYYKEIIPHGREKVNG